MDSRPTQIDSIERHLMDGKSITPLEALMVYGCIRLSSVIHDLRHKRGWEIDCQVRTDENGRDYGQYRLAETAQQRALRAA